MSYRIDYWIPEEKRWLHIKGPWKSLAKCEEYVEYQQRAWKGEQRYRIVEVENA